ncbi:hypothetical protein [Pseudovibrio denitrificans]|uniref:hypothetical protein n=1 Tax=Pseudovibrio denitrificans TaxID=258256 RepID=UPI000B0EA4AB|nr:hypothetical protein [Pseudovibrio denitrificans]
MSLENDLRSRADNKCELCGATEDLAAVAVGPESDDSAEKSILVCSTCSAQMGGTAELDVNHWRCLNESAWSTEPAVQVTAWRLLNKLSGEAWARDLLDTLYLDEETLEWAQSGRRLQRMKTLSSTRTRTVQCFQLVIRSPSSKT